MNVTGHRTRNRPEPDIEEHHGTDPDTTTPHTHTHAEPDAGTDTGAGVAVLVPVTGMIRTIAWEPDVVALARREIGAATVEHLPLGCSLVAGGLQIWLDEDGLLTGRKPNLRSSSLLIAALRHHQQRPPRVLGPMFVGDALLCAAGPTPRHPGSGLSDIEAAAVTHIATSLTHRITIHQDFHNGATHQAAHRAKRRGKC
jgi:hypothetical protein